MRRFTLTIDEWEVEGQITSYDPGMMHGPPDRCWPPDVEWEVNSVVDFDGKDVPNLDAFVKLHEDRINEAAWERATEYDESD